MHRGFGLCHKYPNAEDYLLPDVMSEDKDFENLGNFAAISFAKD